MTANIKIDFKVGGAQLVEQMTRSVSSALQKAAAEQVKIQAKADADVRRIAMKGASDKAKVANEQVKIGAKLNADLQRQAMKGHVDRSKIAEKGAVDAARQAAAAKIAIAQNEANQITRIRMAQMKIDAAAQRQATAAKERQKLREEAAPGRAASAFQTYGGAAAKGAANGIRAVGRLAVGGLQAVAQGVGFDSNVGNAIGRRVQLQDQARRLSNAAYMEGGEGAIGHRVAASDLMGEAQKVASETGMSAEGSLAGLKKFTDITGDLATGRALLLDLSKLAQSTGSSMEDVVATAGEFSKSMGGAAKNSEEAKKKAASIYTVLRGVGGQAKFGSIEFADMAKYGAKIAASAQKFGGSNEDNILKMGALAQFARGGGGAWNAASAATAVTGFANTLATPARRKEFAARGISLEGEGGKIRDPAEIIKDALDATGGKIEPMKKLFANIMGERAVGGLTAEYLQATGGKNDKESKAKGRAAVDKAMKEMTNQQLRQSQIDEETTGFKNSTAGKAVAAQQKFDQLVGDMADKVMPSLIKLAPAAEKAAGMLSRLVEMAANNPWGAVATIIGASISKEIAAAGIGSLIKRLLMGGGGVPVPPPGAPIPAAAPLLSGAGAPVAAILAAAALVGVGMKGGFDESNADDKKGIERSVEMSSLAARIKRGNATDAERAKAQQMVDEGSGPGLLSRMASGAVGGFTGAYETAKKAVNNGPSWDLAGDAAINVARMTPLGIAGGAIGNAAGGGMANDAQDASLQEIKAALENPKPTKIDGSVAVTGLSEGFTALAQAIAKSGRDPASQPINGQ